MKNYKLCAVAAIDKNRGIGFENNLLHRSKRDLAHFKELTTNNIVVMGGNTFRSLDCKPLPNRTNIVLSSSDNIKMLITENAFDYYKDTHILTNLVGLRDCIDYYLKYGNVYIIGGESLYNEFKDDFEELYITHIWTEFDKVDKYFPDILNENFKPTRWKNVEYMDSWVESINDYDVYMRFTKYCNRIKEDKST